MNNYDNILLFLNKKKSISKKELLSTLNITEQDIDELVKFGSLIIDKNQYYTVNVKKTEIDKRKCILEEVKESIKNNNLEYAESLLKKYKNFDNSSSAHYQLYSIYLKQNKYIEAKKELINAINLLNNKNSIYDDLLMLLNNLINEKNNVNILTRQYKDYITYLVNNNCFNELINFIYITTSNENIKKTIDDILKDNNSNIIEKIKTYKKDNTN